MQLVAPARAPAFPGGHSVHEVAPEAVLYHPRLHTVHDVDLCTALVWNLPGSHTAHPLPVYLRPGPQPQLDAPAGEMVPAGHDEQPVSRWKSAPWYLPAGHELQFSPDR